MKTIDLNLKELNAADKEIENFDQVSITVASSDTIRSWSRGEVKNPETINYRTFKPEQGGLFCERIFGPVRDWECACGKFKRIKHKGVICDRCAVEVTLSRVRRERMGHIELAVPVTHIWFYKCLPSRLGLMLDMTSKNLERVIYYEDYIVIDPGSTPLEKKQLLTETELREYEHEFGADSFKVSMGAEAISELLSEIDLESSVVKLEEDMLSTKSQQIRKKLAKWLKLCQGFLSSNTRPEWMVSSVIPVIPPDLRPLVPLDGGRFATSDLNDLYRRVINRNNRLKNLLQLRTPDVIIRNEKRMLQEAVDALFDNGRHGRTVVGSGNRPLKSLSDMLKGKSGRFRQNLLGKRVDYSGRSVIVIGPELKLNQCGLPKKMALTLFEPFIIRRLKELGYVHTVRSAKKMIERKTTEVWDILEEVTKGHPVLLNRAPTLHRLSIQAFEPLLIEGEALRIHPLVCSAYNADFDGDQMAVHVPLSLEAQLEAKILMLAPNNIFSPSSGKPITTPSQDITLGCYFLTHTKCEKVEKEDINKLSIFANTSEVEIAILNKKIRLHQWIRFKNPDFEKDTFYGNKKNRIIVTTAGRVRFNEIWPDKLGFINNNVGNSQLSDIIWQCYQNTDRDETVKTLDKLKELGFKEATRSGCSIGIFDMIIPKEKGKALEGAYSELEKIEDQFKKGIITEGERYNKIIDIWTVAGDQIQGALYDVLQKDAVEDTSNSLYMMIDSGARGNRQQVKQLSGMRGLMAKPSGEIIERPITSNFREGLSVMEYFTSTHGARKGLADTALKTADSGYMTRKLVDVAQDIIVTEIDCGTLRNIEVQSVYEGDEEVVDLKTRIYGRVSAEEVKDPVEGKTILERNSLIDIKIAEKIQEIGIESLKIRSVLTCEAKRGCCSNCYGLNLANGQVAKLGEAVGIIAAQSIGEPGTQLTMRTFHIGGAAHASFKQPILEAKNAGKITYNNIRSVEREDGKFIVLNKSGKISINDSNDIELEAHNIIIGSILEFSDGAKIKVGEKFASWDPYNVPVISEKSGITEFQDMIPGITITQEADESGNIGQVVIEHKEDLQPQIVIIDEKTRDILAKYTIPSGAHINVQETSTVTAGTVLAKTPRKVSKTKDITGGLPRVAELFEARKPKDACDIAKIDGVVEIAGTVRNKRKVIIRNVDTSEEEDHLIPLNKQILALPGDFVKKGSQLTEGPFNPHEMLDILGARGLQEHLVNEVQEVYRLQGVEINDKHIEIIVRQMMRKIKVTTLGDTDFLWGDQVDKVKFDQENKRILEQGGEPAQGQAVLLGITKASLETDSFISAASFQDTTRVLTEAATHGRIDYLIGFKENVIMGHLIPAGTGFQQSRNFELVEHRDEEPEEEISGDTIIDDSDSTAEKEEYGSTSAESDLLDSLLDSKNITDNL